MVTFALQLWWLFRFSSTLFLIDILSTYLPLCHSLLLECFCFRYPTGSFLHLFDVFAQMSLSNVSSIRSWSLAFLFTDLSRAYNSASTCIWKKNLLNSKYIEVKWYSDVASWWQGDFRVFTSQMAAGSPQSKHSKQEEMGAINPLGTGRVSLLLPYTG